MILWFHLSDAMAVHGPFFWLASSGSGGVSNPESHITGDSQPPATSAQASVWHLQQAEARN